MDQQSPRTLKIPAGVAPDRIASVTALHEAGVSASMITKRCRAGGPWRRLLPNVIMLGSGPPTRRQQLRAAVALAGPAAVITGIDALRAHGIDLPVPYTVRLLIPTEQRLMTKEFVTVERTTRLPTPIVRDGLPFAPPARAALDVARATSDLWLLRSSLALTVLHGLCDHDLLLRELNAGNQRGTAAVRAALRQLDATTASLLHAHAMRLLRSSPLPAPRWNVTVYDRKRRPMGYADAWWEEVGLAWQLGPANPALSAPPHGHLAMTTAGVVVVRTPAAEVRAAVGDPDDREPVIRELVAAFAAASKRPRPPVEALCQSIPNTA